LPERDHRTDLRVLGQVAVQLGLVGVMQHVHDVGATHSSRVVQTCVFKAARFQVFDTLCSVVLHVFFGTEHNRAGRTGLGTGRFLSDRHTVRTQGALVGFLVLFRNARHIERTAGNAVAAANAVFLVKIHNAVGVLHDGAWRGTGLQAARVLAVHAAVFANQPFQIASGVFILRKTHDGPGLVGQVGRVVIHPDVVTDFVARIVPFHAGDLTGLTANAFTGVDQLGYFPAHGLAHAGRWGGGCGAPFDIK